LRVDAKILRKFLRGVPSFISEGILAFKEDGNIGATLVAVDTEQTCLAAHKLFRRSFSSYEELGSIGIQDLRLVERVLSRFPREVDVGIGENILVISDNEKKAELAFADPEYIAKPTVQEDKFKPDDYPVKLLQQRDALVEMIANGRTLGADTFAIQVEKNKIVYSAISGENSLKEIRYVDVETEPFEVRLQDSFKKVIDAIPPDAEIKVYLHPEKPIRIDAVGSEMHLTYIVAPIVVEE